MVFFNNICYLAAVTSALFTTLASASSVVISQVMMNMYRNDYIDDGKKNFNNYDIW
jgi:hypothetical protein